MNCVNAILPPLINFGADDRSKATDSTSPQTFNVEDQLVPLGAGDVELVEFLARGAIKIRKLSIVTTIPTRPMYVT